MDRLKNLMVENEDYSAAEVIRDMGVQLKYYMEDTPQDQVLPSSIPPLEIASLPEKTQTLQEAQTWLFENVAPYLNQASLSPNYYGLVTGGTTPAALSGDILATCMDQNVSLHLPSETIATTVEVAALNMLLDLFHLPREDWGIDGGHPGSGTITTGATASNILGLALGREWVLSQAAKKATGKLMSVGQDGLVQIMLAARISKVQVLSTMPHSCVAKAASILGIGRSSIVSITKPNSFLEMDLVALEREASRPGVASILSISTGEVNTGRFATISFQELQKIREICNRENVWVHVDGAFGLFGRVVMHSKNQSSYADIINGCQGLELADSITGDGHKLLNVPYDSGFFFTRHKGLAEEVFQNGNAAYLASGAGNGDGISSPLNIGLENSRRFRALPIYATLLAYGRQGYVNMLERQIGLARRIAGWLFDHPGYDLLPQGEDRQTMVDKTFMVVIFRAANNLVNEGLVKKINKTRRIYVSGTSWDGQPAARIAVSNWQADVERDGALIEEVLSLTLA